MKKISLQDWMNIVLGTWLFASPWIMNYADALPKAAWSAWIAGAAIVVFAAVAGWIPKATREVANILLGAWVAVSPWVLKWTTNQDVMVNAVVVGVLVMSLAIWAAKSEDLFKKWSHRHKNIA